jgi:hypothetical protein
MLACFAPHLLPHIVLLGFLTLGLWRRAFGRCAVCETHRSPKCGCPGGTPESIDARRPKFKSRDPKDYL